MLIQYQGSALNFKDVLYNYLCLREGKKTIVYEDTYGNLTVGIGHLLAPSDGNYSKGDKITETQIQAFFDEDYDRLNMETYAQELQPIYAYNMMLAACSFVWSHGDGQYRSSQLRSGLLANSFNADTVQSYLKANWDIRKPVNQERNRRDFSVGFSSTPWKPGFFLPQPA